jgi:hypothetical protein
MNIKELCFLFKRGNFEIKERGFENFIDPNICYNREISCYCCEPRIINYLTYPYKAELESFLEQYLKKEEVSGLLEELDRKQRAVLKRIY